MVFVRDRPPNLHSGHDFVVDSDHASDNFNSYPGDSNQHKTPTATDDNEISTMVYVVSL